jgi:septum formation protein
MDKDYSGLVLASASPRRQELLGYLGRSFKVVAPDIDETPTVGESAEELVKRLALQKAFKVQEYWSMAIILAADTAVVIDDEVLGKPTDLSEAREMLLKLSGREHQVITGVALLKQQLSIVKACITTVKFKSSSLAQIERYLKTGESMDKAGAYGAQGAGVQLIESINGSYSNVVGLDLALVESLLAELGA